MSKQKLEINELILKVQGALKEAQYSEMRIAAFFPTWARLTEYMTERNEQILNAKTGLNFLEEAYGITVFKNLPRNLAICVRAVNVLTDFQQHGMLLAKARRKVHVYHPQFQALFQGYIDKRRTEGHSEDTLQSYAIYLDRFSDYLHSREVKSICELDNTLVLGFTGTFTNYSPAVIHNTLCSLRTFFHYLFQEGFVSKNFAYVVPRDGYRSRTKVPSAYPKEDVEKLLKTIDRGNPKGKRDYAIILLAARLGLRAQDICDLSFEHLKWDTNTIEMIQGKTEKPITLPLLEDVGQAIIDYLKYARPECTTTNAIFLRLIPPMGKLEAPTLHSIVTHHMRKAGIQVQDGKKHGPHALRHSLASALLEDKTPLPVISEILGHTSTASTSVYLKIDINQLRSCSLTPPPFDWNHGEEVF
ncbi:tyrosine-type recombinase/integrase [Paenibacillus alkaliterrae]|uniref:site-specific integrase n=1 Tax=Paenibacillus alkaliterrae TaxID=320909 RepID=UPI001F1D5140|nr:site-specific integrase [Paenibacillus alkaliterrae]MCF2941835.1 tyrosine-type recombinase/integrase [Paenibacillus alkaliterrae]